MGRILAIDYGKVRCGIAVTDPLNIIATGLKMVLTKELLAFLKDYISKENVTEMVMGLPINLKSEDTDATENIRKFGKTLEKTYPEIPLIYWDERFTSKIAFQSMISSGMNKKNRQDKGTIDIVSATIILQEYMEHKKNQSNKD